LYGPTGAGALAGMFEFLESRQRTAERMDAEDVDRRDLARSLRFLRRINRLLGYTRTTLKHLARFSRSWKPGERIDVLDVGTGSADIPRAIIRWGLRRGFDIHAVGVDRHPGVVAEATAGEAELNGRLRIVRADALALPLADGSFDYAITQTFLHHLDDEAVVAVLASMGRVARRGVVAADLLRCRRAYLGVKLLSALANPVVRHDGPASVAQAFTPAEVAAMRDRAGLSFAKFYRHMGYRFVLAGEKIRR